MPRRMAFAIAMVGCSSSRDRESTPAPIAATAQPPSDAARPSDAGVAFPPPWMTELLATGGPGLCASIRDGDLRVWRRDERGRLIEELSYDAHHGRDPVERIELRYDRAGRVTRVTRRGARSHDFDETKDVSYDTQGRVVRVRTHPEAGPFAGQDKNVTYRWQGTALAHVGADEIRLGQDADPTNPIGYVIAFQGTVREACFYDGSPAPQPENEYSYTYDRRGRLVEVQSTGWAGPAVHRQLEWDSDGQLVADRDDAGYRTVLTRYTWRDRHVVAIAHLDRGGKELDRDELRYDAQGRLVESLHFVAPDPEGRLVAQDYDPDAQVLASTYMLDDEARPPTRVVFRYDCGPPATPP